MLCRSTYTLISDDERKPVSTNSAYSMFWYYALPIGDDKREPVSKSRTNQISLYDARTIGREEMESVSINQVR